MLARMATEAHVILLEENGVTIEIPCNSREDAITLLLAIRKHSNVKTVWSEPGVSLRINESSGSD